MPDPLFHSPDHLRAPDDASIEPAIPDYIPIRVEIPPTLAQGIQFPVDVYFDPDHGTPGGEAGVQLRFKDWQDGDVACGIGHGHPNLVVSLTGHTGRVYCRIDGVPGSPVKAEARDSDGNNPVLSEASPVQPAE